MSFKRSTTPGVFIRRPYYRLNPHWMALFAAVFTLPLLFVGGSVTTYRVGMAVPDWPTTFGINMFLYDFWNAPFGVRVEHSHRLYGAAVGLATIGLTLGLLLFDRRRWMKVLGVVALAAVIIQGILGGTRVTQVSTLLAAVHGCTGQAFFGLMVALCVFTGRDWLSGPTPEADSLHLRPAACGMVALAYLQVALGAWLRHYQVPAAAVIHAAVGAGVLIFALWLWWRVETHRQLLSLLAPSARCLGGIAVFQCILGIAALAYLLPLGDIPRPVGFYQAVFRTAHQTNGALLLASSIVLALRALRHLGTGEPSPVIAYTKQSLEVVA